MFTSNLTKVMKQRKITIRKLAVELNLSTRTIIRARGPLISQCKLETLGQIASALGVKVCDLFNEK